MIEHPKVTSWDEVERIAKSFLRSRYGDRIARINVDGVWLQPHWEEGNWVTNGTVLLKIGLFKKELIRFRLEVNPMNGEVARFESLPSK